MTNPASDRDDGLGRTLAAVGIAGVALTLLSPFVFGPGALRGVAIGAGLAFANLFAIAFVVRGFLRGAGLPFGVAGATKFAALLFVVWLVLKNGWAEVMPLVLGYTALPLGIVVGQLSRPTPTRQKA